MVEVRDGSKVEPWNPGKAKLLRDPKDAFLNGISHRQTFQCSRIFQIAPVNRIGVTVEKKLVRTLTRGGVFKAGSLLGN